MAATETTKAIRHLARSVGVQMEYNELDGTRKRASQQALRSVLAAFGLDIGAKGQLAGEALFQLERRRAARLVEPVHVAWDGEAVPLRLTAPLATDAELTLTLETGDTQSLVPRADGRLLFPAGLPFGYHELVIRSGA
ncbi:MAG: malQ, partial [Thermoleophilia bacterium]|nr:malQ [Thermoleophilia bacterium]